MHQKGMTLVELMVVLVVASIIGIAVINMFTLSNRTFMDQNKVIDVQRDGRLVMDYIARTLREARLNPECDPAFEGIKFRDDTDYSLIIDRDVDLDGDLDNNSKEVIGFRVRPETDGTKTLMRGFDIGFGNVRWHEMANNITDFKFVYFDASSAQLNGSAPLSDISSIEVTITFQDDKSVGGDFTRSYKSRIDLRNPPCPD